MGPITNRQHSPKQGSEKTEAATSVQEPELSVFLDDDETVTASLAGARDTVKHDTSHRTERFTPATDSPLVVVSAQQVTLSVVPDGPTTGETERVAVPFWDIESVSTDTSAGPVRITLELADSERWVLPVDESQGGDILPVVEAIRSGVEVYSRVDAAVRAVREGQADLLRDGGDWAFVKDRYEFLRERLADAQRSAEGTAFADAAPLTERLVTAERTLEEVATLAHLARIHRACDTGERVLYEDGQDDVEGWLQRAVESYRAALSRVERHSDDPLADDDLSATPGAVASDSIYTALGVAIERIATLTEQLLAESDHRLTYITDYERISNPESTVESLEPLVDRYRSLLYCCWGNDELLSVPRTVLQRRVEDTVDTLLDVIDRAAQRAEWSARAAVVDAEYETAASEFETAREYYDKAATLASEFRAGDARRFDSRREAVTDRLHDLPIPTKHGRF